MAESNKLVGHELQFAVLELHPDDVSLPKKAGAPISLYHVISYLYTCESPPVAKGVFLENSMHTLITHFISERRVG